MTPEHVWWVMGLALVAYVLTGGADFGAGVWDLFARGPRAARQRDLISHAIAPIWEANHIWLIFLVVALFTVFPVGLAAISVALHVPLVLALLGIVLRGAAFAFRSYGPDDAAWRRRWGRVFSVSSLLTPALLGMVPAALATGAIRWQGGAVTSGFATGWTTGFAAFTGAFTVALCALLAAVYLTLETDDRDLQEDFRRRALVADVVAGGLALGAFFAARAQAPAFFDQLTDWSGGAIALLGALVAGAVTLYGLVVRRYRLARWAVGAQVGLVVLGWGLGMAGYVVRPDITLENAGTQAATLGPLGPALVIGGVLIAPSLWLLFRVFKGAERPPRPDRPSH